ncbi:MAG: lipid-A-disaccharide synthase, partial [Alphaproteobacteria bacterium]|nr:lipid-A-disaccharide synthase [Alphaproteobacteria bacterium]
MKEPVKLFIVAGEPSGDMLGANLVRNMRAYGDVKLAGVGGPALESVGLNPEFPMNDLAVMGYVDVLKRWPLLLRRARQTLGAILEEKPDVVVLVDAQEFSKRIAAGLAKKRPDLPVVLYVAPSVWAWKPKRAAHLARYYTDILCLFPFEPKAIEDLGGMATSYVGHPALDLAGDAGRRASGRQSNLIILMPGSRGGEIERHRDLLFD